MDWIVKDDRIGFVAPTREAYVGRYSLYNDPELTMLAMFDTDSNSPGPDTHPPVFKEQRERAWEKIADRSVFVLDVHDVEDERFIGEALLTNIAWPHASAEVGIIIFDPADRGRGRGAAICRLLMAYAFDGLGLRRAYLKFLAVNDAVVAAVDREAATFNAQRAGIEREAIWAFGDFQDVVTYDVLKREFPPHPATAPLRRFARTPKPSRQPAFAGDPPTIRVPEHAAM